MPDPLPPDPDRQQHGAPDKPAQHAEHDGHDGHDGHAGHDRHAGHDPELFRLRFWVCLVLTVPVVLASHLVSDQLGLRWDVPGRSWVGPVLGSVVFWWGGWPFLVGAVREVRDRAPGMMLLVAMAITVAYIASLATSVGVFDLDFWWELAALVTIMLLGHWQEMKAIGQARGALAALAALLPDEAERVAADGRVEAVPVTGLRVGDVVLVRPGGRVPADGRIVDGAAELDESMITGESRPVVRSAGDRVVAGTVATDSAIRVRVEAVGEQTALAGIQRMVAQAQESSGRAQLLADRFAAALFYLATGTAVLTVLVWTALGDPDEAVVRAVTVLVIACPHALGLAIPLVVALSTALAARSGILVKDRLALERMRTVDAVLFDKTGTLTRGEHAVTDLVTASGTERDEVLRIAAGVESDSEHPLARAIVAAAGATGPAAAAGFRSLPGRGVRATIDGTEYAVGGPALLRELGLSLSAELEAATARWSARGAAVLHLVRLPETVLGAFALTDEVRPEARRAIDELRAEGVRTIAMITGDARSVADAVAGELGFRPGVDEVFAEVLPAEKDERVAELQRRGLTVAMVGDGVNDAPALARADVGIAIGAGTDVAIESAGVVLASSDPRGVGAVLRMSRASYRKMRQNLAWAAGYNVVALPLAAGVLAGAGVALSPALAALLMSASTIVVALNAQLLRRVRLGSAPD
ncbi:Cu2+-exporting ATPase [Micromonospora luteifusca]|uniref:Cu2+-exporting ATPase n=1 Tax=Micromonospora luteifusca TaxID=709860 RepID=A0ABS2LVJ3_9ACTN|nr:heavy metal translocating P-type ATPase [Micromonospora luteifusca]MBM7492208.1 Cu2+-exporting ATPase [Micromonospora luteifusca]